MKHFSTIITGLLIITISCTTETSSIENEAFPENITSEATQRSQLSACPINSFDTLNVGPISAEEFIIYSNSSGTSWEHEYTFANIDYNSTNVSDLRLVVHVQPGYYPFVDARCDEILNPNAGTLYEEFYEIPVDDIVNGGIRFIMTGVFEPDLGLTSFPRNYHTIGIPSKCVLIRIGFKGIFGPGIECELFKISDFIKLHTT